MLQKPRDYDQAQAYDSDFERLPVGGYVCSIKKIEETTTPKTGTAMLVVYFDIAEGDYKDYFTKQYKRDKSRELTSGRTAKWRGTYNVFPYTNEGLTNPSFKGLLVCIEKSNYNFKVNWPLNLDAFKDKKVGLLFREEEYEGYDGSVKTSVKACATRTVDCINNEEFNLPAKKTLNKTNGGGASAGTGETVYSSQEFSSVTVEDDDLPFD